MKFNSAHFFGLLFSVLLLFMACEDDENSEDQMILSFCDTPVSTQDTLLVGPHHFFIVASISSDTGQSSQIELVDLNSFRIDTLSNLSVQQVKIKGLGKCFETNLFTCFTSSNGIAKSFSGAPDWAINTLNQAVLEIKYNGASYYLEDSNVNL